jgi:hypothetical protein
MAFLIIEKSTYQDIGKTIPLQEEVLLIGRLTHESSSDIGLQDDYISRRHAQISYHDGNYMLCDLDSKNGTELDSQRIEPGKLYPLVHDSVIGLGIAKEGPRVILRFKGLSTTATANIPEMNNTKTLSWLRVDEGKKEAWIDGKLITLARKEYRLLCLLYHNAGNICSKDDIIADVWYEVQDPGGISDSSIDQLVHRLRDKIEPDPSKITRLISRKGFGYVLV